MTGRGPAKEKLSPKKIYNGHRGRIGKSCATCANDPSATAEQKALLRSGPQVVEHLAFYHKVLISVTVSVTEEARVTPLADYFTEAGAYIADPIDKVDASRRLIEQRVVKASEDVAQYGVDPTMFIPAGELADDVAVDAPSDHKYRQVTGPMKSTVRDGLCVLCTNDPDAPWTARGKPFNATVQALEQHADGCFRSRIEAQHRLIFRETTGEADHASEHQSSDESDDGSNDGGQRRCEGVWLCPDPVCVSNGREFPSTRGLVNHCIAVHHVRLSGRGKGYSGRSRADFSAALGYRPAARAVPDWLRRRRQL